MGKLAKFEELGIEESMTYKGLSKVAIDVCISYKPLLYPGNMGI